MLGQWFSAFFSLLNEYILTYHVPSSLCWLHPENFITVFYQLAKSIFLISIVFIFRSIGLLKMNCLISLFGVLEMSFVMISILFSHNREYLAPYSAQSCYSSICCPTCLCSSSRRGVLLCFWEILSLYFGLHMWLILLYSSMSTLK